MFPPEGPRRSVEDFLGGRVDVGEPSRPVEREDPDAHGFERLLEEVAQKNRPTTERKSSSVRTPPRYPRNVEAPGIPRLYQARCSRISRIPASPRRRCISSPWRRMSALRASEVGPAKAPGAPLP